MTAVIYTKIGENRGKLRLWVQGQKMAHNGVQVGAKYDVEASAQMIRMVFSPDGSRTVSRKVRNGSELPVIDLNTHQVSEAFKANDRVRVVIRENAIEVTLHHCQRAKQAREHRVLSKLRLGEPLVMGSICHGGGVLDHAIHTGLQQAGISSVLGFANELEEAYLDASMRNNPIWDPNSIAINGPMQDVEWRNLLRSFEGIDVLKAGLPCTGASLSGRAKNGLKFAEQHETAGSLFVAFLKAIEILKPGVIVLENVPPYQTTISYHVITSVLAEMDYVITDAVLCGSEFGALEHRKRLCMVAVSTGLPSMSLDTLQKPGASTLRLGDLLDTMPDDDPMWKTYDYLQAKQERDVAAGKGFRRQILTPDATKVGTIGRSYNKARSTEPFLAHPSGDGRSRLFTVAEHARIKTIPSTLVEGVSNTIGHEILGQSVIHNVFASVGNWLGTGLQRAA